MKALLWLKANWKWLLFPIGILLFLAGRMGKQRNVQLVSPVLEGHLEEAQKIESKAAAEMKVAAQERDAQLDAIREANTKALAEIRAEAERKAAELQQKPEDVNAFLKEVGKNVRGQSTKT